MSDVQGRHPLRGEERSNVADKCVLQHLIDRSERLVEQYQTRLRGERSGDGNALTFAPGQSPHGTGTESWKSNQVEHLVHAVCSLTPVKAGRTSLHSETIRNVPSNIEMGEQAKILEDEPDSSTKRRQRGDVVAVNGDASGFDRLQSGNGSQQGAFAATVRAHYRHDSRALDTQVEVAKDLSVAKRDRQISNVEGHCVLRSVVDARPEENEAKERIVATLVNPARMTASA